MENSQIIGEGLFKGGQYFEDIFKKIGVVFALEVSLTDPIHTALQPIHN